MAINEKNHPGQEALKLAKPKDEAMKRPNKELTVHDDVRSDVAGVLSTKGTSAEKVSETAALSRLKSQYEQWKPERKAGCAWEEVEGRLLANDGYYLRLAEAMQLGGVLFGTDKAGNPLVADGGSEPILAGMTYRDARKAVMFRKNKGKQISTGYEFFPFDLSHHWGKSAEILAYEEFTKGPFIGVKFTKKWKASWLKSDEPDRSWYAYLGWDADKVLVSADSPRIENPELGVRRLLRIKRA